MNQFDFGRKWRKKISPMLNESEVKAALNTGDDYKPGNPPWLHGRGPLNGQRAREGCLSWHERQVKRNQ